MTSDAAAADRRAAQDIFDDLMEDPNTMISQRALLSAYTFLEESSVEGMPMTAICGACLFNSTDWMIDVTQCKLPDSADQ